jgi:hypothetical protein
MRYGKVYNAKIKAPLAGELSGTAGLKGANAFPTLTTPPKGCKAGGQSRPPLLHGKVYNASRGRLP